MSECYRLFVYGHLMRGGVGYRRLGLGARTTWLGEARVRGLLYDLGDYPGLVLGGDAIVQGELLALYDPALWVVLDDYEDCEGASPDQSEYRRETVALIDGQLAWVYVYARQTDEKSVIPSGIWKRL